MGDEASVEDGAPVEIGEILAEKFRVEEILGYGGMGVVVAATHLQLEQRVALKFMRGECVRNQEYVTRFLREARAAAQLKNTHIARASDIGLLEDGAPYMVLEYLEGIDLQDQVDDHGPIDCSVAADYLVQACVGISEAHSQGIVHRDLKPANLYLTRAADGSPLIKILDFGIAKARFDGLSTSTQTIMGSPYYMSPEQMRSSRDVDPRSDIWALGAILYFLISGRAPFEGDTLPQMVLKITNDPPASLSDIRIPDQLEELIYHCLQKDPDRRPQSAAELAGRLAPFCSEEGRALVSKAKRIERAITQDGLAKSADPSTNDASGSKQAAFLHSTTLEDASMALTAEELRASGRSPARFVVPALLGIGLLVGGYKVATLGGQSTPEPKAAAAPSPDVPVKVPATIETTPPGADVYVHGKLLGQTPYEHAALPGSQIDLRIVHDGYRLLEREVVWGGEPVTMRFSLELEPSHAVPKTRRAKKRRRSAKKSR